MRLNLTECYKILGISASATQEMIRNRFLYLSRMHHPDAIAARHGRVATAADTAKFTEILSAYKTLSSQAVAAQEKAEPRPEPKKPAAQQPNPAPKPPPKAEPPKASWQHAAYGMHSERIRQAWEYGEEFAHKAHGKSERRQKERERKEKNKRKHKLKAKR